MPDPIDSREAVFRTCLFGGFEKTEVLAYIDRLRQENAAAVEQLQTDLEAVTQARGELESQAADFEAKLRESEKQLEERSGRLRELNGQVNVLKSQVLSSKKTRDEANRALEEQRVQNLQLSDRLQRTEAVAKNYTELSERVGDILLCAHREADAIVEEARSEARSIRNRVAADGSRMTDELAGMKSELEEIRGQMQVLTERLLARTGMIDKLLEAIDTAGPLPGDPQGGDPGERPAVSRTAQRVFDAAGAVQEAAPQTRHS